MKNIGISNLHKKDIEHCTSRLESYIRKKMDKIFKKCVIIILIVKLVMEKENFNS